MKVDISSTMVEKSIDGARNFLAQLLGPAVEESGLLIRDQLTMWRFRNQVKMLNKAMDSCRKNNISPKNISLKLLCPLLDYAGLEDEEELQDKWANLLTNMVDSDQNIDNHVFPYLLSQISIAEYRGLEQLVEARLERIAKLNEDLTAFKAEYPVLKAEYESEIMSLADEIELRRRHNVGGGVPYKPIDGLQSSQMSFTFKLELMAGYEAKILQEIKAPDAIDESGFKEQEIGNLTRLGILKSVAKPFIKTDSLEIPNEPSSEYLTVDLDIEIDVSADQHVLTKLGELFILACKEKMVGVRLS